MAVRIRLKKMGRKKRPFYRLVAIDSKKRRDGLEIERLGWYNPVDKNSSYEMNEERIQYWLKQGASPSDTVSGLFRRAGLSYKWDLLKKGTDEKKVEILVQEFIERQKNRVALKKEKSKIKKMKASDNTEEAPAEAVAEEAPAEAAAEEAPAEAAAEEAPEKEKKNKKK